MANNQATTQQFVAIKEIRDNVVYLKNGGLRQILIVSGVNFDLKSEIEQNLIINGFQNFINMLDFPIQVFIHSRKINIDSYLEKMAQFKEKEPNELLKIQIDEYIQFIKIFVEQNAIITKNFFVVVPYDPLPINVSGGLANQGLGGLFKGLPFGKKKSTVEEAEEKTPAQGLQQLSERVDQVLEGLTQIGLKASILNDEELTELFYNLYNPQLTEKKIPLEKEKPKNA